MQETLDKPLLIKPLQGMNQYQEALSLPDSEFSLVSGTYPSQAGVQSRFPGKTIINKFASAVLSIADFIGARLIQTKSEGLIKEGDDGTFATLQNASATQTKNRDCFAVSPSVQLCVRSNGEERTKVIDSVGNIYDAEIPVPTGVSSATPAAGGTLTAARYYGYAYCYVASTAYPYISRTNAINGQVWPRGNPKTIVPVLTTAVNKRINLVLIASPVSRPDIDKTWIFRTAGYSTLDEATNAVSAGLLYWIAEQASSLTAYSDMGAADGVDQIEMDNFGASTFKNVIYYDPYWIGFGADIFRGQVTWTAGSGGGGGFGNITLIGDTWYPGRTNQKFKLTGVTTGGEDGKGTFTFVWDTTTTGHIPASGSINLPTMTAGTKYITISPPTANIYRSKAYDPFAWGWTRTIGTSIESLEWVLKLGGGNGTAITVVPTEAILKVDTEFPTKSYAFNLQLIDDFDQFKRTQKTISETLSVSNQHSQFYAQNKDGETVLWGMDYKTFAILQSNGITQDIISFPVQTTLRKLTTTKADQVFCHGIYDPYTQCNCMWVTLASSPEQVHYLIYQHAPTGFWGVMEDLDVISSARIQDTSTGQIKIRLGTSSGIYGNGFVANVYYNWQSATGTITGSTSTVITNTAAAFTSAIIGTWVLITDADDQNEQWARISAQTATTFTIDRTYINGVRFATLQIVPSAGWKYYIGLIECRLQKYIDFKGPNTDKKITELSLSQENTVRTLVRFSREWQTSLLKQSIPAADSYKDGSLSNSFFGKINMPSERIKSFGIELINREYTAFILRNIVIKFTLVP